ncbi:hypothetical protein [Salinigranum rubrum]|uniref:hypothetical protein n=1 Tax=Salinigranum rubrum TaxID=755307 RepID=UPI0013A5378E|nr:hypothetical protein [Salinigranum rubrum]
MDYTLDPRKPVSAEVRKRCKEVRAARPIDERLFVEEPDDLVARFGGYRRATVGYES